MKKLLIFSAAMMLTASVFGQAKKPTIMVVPSERYCIANGYSMTFDNQGTQTVLPDYKKALQNDSDLRLAISKMSGIMSDREFPLKDLEQELRNIANESAESSLIMGSAGGSVVESPIDVLKRTAKADIIMDLDFSVERQGPKKHIKFILNGLDAYTSKNIASSSGAGEPSSAASVDLLVEEAVLSHMDEFCGRLQAHFDDMFNNGREVKIMVKLFDGADVNLNDEYDYNGTTDELNIFIEDWMADNTVNGRFSISDATENFQRYEQVRIPMFYERNGRQRAMDTRTFVNNLKKFLSEAPFNLESKVYMRGLGEAWLIIGEK
ncbi:MAG: hypothetical protein IKP62_06910 [Salinivirgaceae bacterium]|nr:hypothetical protein [Salinivirgaceae bacterium]